MEFGVFPCQLISSYILRLHSELNKSVTTPQSVGMQLSYILESLTERLAVKLNLGFDAIFEKLIEFRKVFADRGHDFIYLFYALGLHIVQQVFHPFVFRTLEKSVQSVGTLKKNQISILKDCLLHSDHLLLYRGKLYALRSPHFS